MPHVFRFKTERANLEVPMAYQTVYVLTNPAMPDLVKIGMTTQDDVKLRQDQLYSTGVPFPFDLEYACKVDDARRVETALHIAFGPYRVNPRREFFKIEPEQAIAILKLLDLQGLQETTSAIEAMPSTVEPIETEAAKVFKARSPKFNFEEMGIPLGSVLEFTESEFSAEVSSSNKVSFEGQQYSLTALTRKLLGIDYNVQPGRYWVWNGQNLRTRYFETYARSDASSV
jgi:hypothetical protein